MRGHSVIAVPVVGLDALVRERARRYDDSFVSRDPAFCHAHVTLLAPWLPHPTAEDLERVRTALADEPPIEFTLSEVRQFPGGVIYVAPDPEAPFRRLTERLRKAFPQTPPYAGEFSGLVPHLTVDHVATGATRSSIAAELGSVLPVRETAARVDLQWWANHDCHLRHTWALGESLAPAIAGGNAP